MKFVFFVIAVALLTVLGLERFSVDAKKCFASGGDHYDWITGKCYDYPPMSTFQKPRD